MRNQLDIVDKLTENILATNYERIPAEAIEIEKREVLDVLGCLVAGATAPGCRVVAELVKEDGGREESTIMMYGGKVPAQNAALVQSSGDTTYGKADRRPGGIPHRLGK